MIAGGGLQTFTTWFSWNLIYTRRGVTFTHSWTQTSNRGCKPLELSGSSQICWIESAVYVSGFACGTDPKDFSDSVW